MLQKYNVAKWAPPFSQLQWIIIYITIYVTHRLQILNILKMWTLNGHSNKSNNNNNKNNTHI